MTSQIPQDTLVEKAVNYLQPLLPFQPTVGVVLGSGMGALAERPPVQKAIPYAEIPGFPTCSVAGHPGQLILTDRCGPRVAFLQGRVHKYEGHSLNTITRPIRVLASLGVQTLVVTCAAGALGTFAAGELMIIDDHLNLMGDNPLIGHHQVALEHHAFVEMTDAYEPSLKEIARRSIEAEGLPVRRGVLAALTGPTYETQAEAVMLQRLGADAVSMSVVPEVIVARRLNLRVLGLALIANRSGRPSQQGISHEAVLAMVESKGAVVGAVLEGILRHLETGSGQW